jgi:uncharacterized membrane protein
MSGWILPALAAVFLWGIVGILQKLGSNRLGANGLLLWVTAGYLVMLPVVLWRSGTWAASADALLLGAVAGTVNGFGTWLLFRSLEHGARPRWPCR